MGGYFDVGTHMSQPEDPPPTYQLSDYAPTMGGALLVATLAYPASNEEDLRLLTAMRLSGRRAVHAMQPGAEWFESEIVGVGLPIDFKRLEGGKSRLEARLQKRIDAGHVALHPLLAAECGEASKHMWGGKWSRRATIKEMTARGEVSEFSNFEGRYWQPARPVIHLAAAWVAMLRIHHRSEGSIPSVLEIIEATAWRDELVARAQTFEDLLSRSDIGVSADVLIKFRQ